MNVIYYFSGSGNSLAVAKHLAEEIKETEVIHIRELKDKGKIDNKYERVGFIFPVYNVHMPLMVKEIISEVRFSSNQYIFGVITHAGSRGMALEELRNIVKLQGGVLSGEFRVRMPGSYIAEYGAFPMSICNYLYKREKNKVKEIALKILNAEETNITNANLLSKLFDNVAQEKLKKTRTMDEGFKVKDCCTSCGICSSICPADNIRLVNSKPTWNNRCEQCMACIQWCPVKAIEYLDKTKNRKQYTHPEIIIKDMKMKRDF